MRPSPLAGVALIETSAGPLRLGRAWPRAGGAVHLEYTDADRGRVAAQWLPARAEAERVARASGAPVELHPDHPVVVHWGGADRQLPALRTLVLETGTRLVGHRPGRRGVVQLRDGTYAKVVRPGRSRGLVAAGERADAAAAGHFDVPAVMRHDPDAGVVVWTELAGPTLLDLGRAAPSPDVLAGAWRAAGAAVSGLHGADRQGLPVHDARAEVATARRWLDAAVAVGVLPPAGHQAAYERLLSGTPGPLGVLHRDLHDKQVVVGARIGLLDLDTLAVGERALDLANALVHLELRVDQGLMTAAAAQVARRAFLEGAAPDPETRERIPAHLGVARLRLAGVYAFRPRWRALAVRWHAQATGTAPC